MQRRVQLGIEYDPEPPFDSGSTRSAPPQIVELVRTIAADLVPTPPAGSSVG